MKLLLFLVLFFPLSAEKLKVLHLTFQHGCAKEFESVGKELSLQVKTWMIPDLPPKFFDGISGGNVLYNMTHERAERIWNLHKEEFEQYDVIITSDTAPLCRIFLQNGWKKPLVIWVCNRFDYADNESLDGKFPDEEYYQLFQDATRQKNVTFVAYTAFERYYTKSYGIDIGDLKIEPCCQKIPRYYFPSIPKTVVKKESFFLPAYHNETIFMNLSSFLTNLGINNYCGKYNGPMDLRDFRAIIHLPYSWSNLAFFENISLGIPYFIPSISFFEELVNSGEYFHPNLPNLIQENLYHLSEWYTPEHSEIITYFDSWEDLLQKLETTDFDLLREKIKTFALSKKQKALENWNQVFEQCRERLSSDVFSAHY